MDLFSEILFYAFGLFAVYLLYRILRAKFSTIPCKGCPIKEICSREKDK